MTNDPEQIRREIERTRTDLSENVNALGEKVNPSSIARRQTDRVRGAAVSVKESIMGSASDAGDAGHRAVGVVSDTISDAPSTVASKAKGNPLAAGLIAFGAGLLVSSLIPASQKEQEAAQAIKDQAEPVVSKLTDAAKEVASNLQEPAQQAVEEVKSTATDAAQTVKEEGTSAAQDVKGQAADSKDRVQQSATS
ncbi:DUF3618 domain-containing protein [Nakamurella sp. GG22]